MKLECLTVTVACALACSAAEQTLTYTTGDTSLGDGVVTFTYDGNSKITHIVSNVAKGDTVTLVGDTIPLAENPTFTGTGGSLVISNTLDGTGTLAFQPQTYEETISWTNDTTYLQLDPDWTLIFPGKNLDEWQPVTSEGPADSHNPNHFNIYNVSRYVSNEVAYADMQAHFSYVSSGNNKPAIKCIWAKLKQTEDGIAAIIERSGNFSAFEESVEGEDISYYASHTGSFNKSYPYQLMTRSYASGGTKGYGINQLTMKYIGALPTVRLEGSVTNSTDGAYMPVSVAAGISVTAGAASGVNRLGAGTSISNAGVFTADDVGAVVTNYAAIYSSGTFRYERTADSANSGAAYYTSGFLATNTWQIIAQWCTLNDITNLVGKMTGANIGGAAKDSESQLYNYTIAESGLVATGQVQFLQNTSGGTTLRCLVVEFRQLGDHVGAKGLWCWSPSNKALGTDLIKTNYGGTKADVATDASKAAYNVHEFTVYSARVGRFAAVGLSATNDLAFAEGSAIEIAGSAAGRMAVTFCRTNSLPEKGTVDVFAGGDMVLDPQPVMTSLEAEAYVGGTCQIRVHEGGMLYQWGQWTPGPKQIMELRGGTLISGNPDNTSPVGKAFISHLYLYDGAVVTGLQFRIGHTQSATNVAWWKVRGSLPSHCYNTVHTETGANNARRTIKFDVWDVTGNNEADLVMHGPFRRYVSDWAHTNVVVRKTGAGTMLFMQPCGTNNEPMGPIDLEEGTWLLGASDAVGPRTPFRLKGGTLAAAAGTANSCGPLTIYAAGGAISLGEGATLTFADSSAMPWTATEKVTVYGFAEKAIRFGTSKAAVPRPRMFKM
ncbi:MAG: hypothetical protein IJH50_06405 [Kiritimatiellae bacterium]|nr:hypothetical protein [Kiritimatiellia bacterium]